MNILLDFTPSRNASSWLVPNTVQKLKVNFSCVDWNTIKINVADRKHNAAGGIPVIQLLFRAPLCNFERLMYPPLFHCRLKTSSSQRSGWISGRPCGYLPSFYTSHHSVTSLCYTVLRMWSAFGHSRPVPCIARTLFYSGRASFLFCN